MDSKIIEINMDLTQKSFNLKSTISIEDTLPVLKNYLTYLANFPPVPVTKEDIPEQFTFQLTFDPSQKLWQPRSNTTITDIVGALVDRVYIHYVGHSALFNSLEEEQQALHSANCATCDQAESCKELQEALGKDIDPNTSIN